MGVLAKPLRRKFECPRALGALVQQISVHGLIQVEDLPHQQVEAAHHGEVVAIDVDTGTWAVGDNVIAATGRLQEKRPEAVNVLSEKVGYPALRHFGGRPLRRAE